MHLLVLLASSVDCVSKNQARKKVNFEFDNKNFSSNNYSDTNKKRDNTRKNNRNLQDKNFNNNSINKSNKNFNYKCKNNFSYCNLAHTYGKCPAYGKKCNNCW